MKIIKWFFKFLLFIFICFACFTTWRFASAYLNKPFESGERLESYTDIYNKNESANLTLGISQKEAIYSSDEKITFFVSIKNIGNSQLKNIRVNMNLPSQDVLIQGEIEQSLESLASGQSHSFKCEAKISAFESTKKEPFKIIDYSAKISYTYAEDDREYLLEANSNFKVASDFGAVNERQVSEMPWLYSRSDEGWVRRDCAADGIYMKFDMQTSYRKGVSAKANAEFSVYLGGDSYRVKSIIGSDLRTEDENAGIEFVILNDGVEVYRSKEILKGDVDMVDIILNHCRVVTFRIESTSDKNSKPIGNLANLRISRSSAVEQTENITNMTIPF